MLTSLTRRQKRLIYLFGDVACVPVSLYLAFCLRFGTALPLAQVANPDCKVVGISVNTQHMSEDEAVAYLKEVEDRMYDARLSSGMITDTPHKRTHDEGHAAEPQKSAASMTTDPSGAL